MPTSIVYEDGKVYWLIERVAAPEGPVEEAFYSHTGYRLGPLDLYRFELGLRAGTLFVANSEESSDTFLYRYKILGCH